MYADWMKNISLEITAEDIKEYEENKKKDYHRLFFI